ncbi:MAG: prolyl oligopeptidase family serine peptidase [Bacteroidota bacterium]|jgi:dipeptidyl aminopeptidase/acylaminoacyl peptidase|nr:prolyl oligopeptidase family serine peptidase [Flammeovirgaceae bacterium]MCZ8071773.1 prolyl oligopeptidase family serine peptidase [Cytophagales bacterium]
MKNALYLFFLITTSVLGQSALEQFISHPIESNFAASVDGKNIAWVINDHGKRNIMIKIGSELPKMFTDYQQDDGQEISQLVFSPNGLKLLFVRGGAPNRAGQSPNPASLADAPDMSIYFKDIVSKSQPTRLTNGSSPQFTRDGLKFLFIRGGQIFESLLEVNANPKPLFTARGFNTGPKFSPNGIEVLFTSIRGDHSFIGVYHTINRTVRWIAPDVTNDISPCWSPDGKSISFLRFPGKRIGELDNYTVGSRFSIMVADAEGSRAKAIWSSPSADGGFAQSVANPLAWTTTNRILFFSEHLGWNHIYSISPDGTDLKDITPGEGEVENYVLNPAQDFVYFDGNREDINRRHLWKTSVSLGTPVAVTTGEGIEMFPAFGGNDLYCFRAAYNASKTLARVDETRKAFAVLNPAKLTTFSASGFVKPEAVVFKAADGTTIHGQLFINRTVPGKRAAVVYMHGGPIRQMLLGFHYSDYYIHCYAFNNFMANQGYAVLSINYRNGVGYGRDFRMAKNQGPRGASEYQDVIAAGKFLQYLPEVDANKIGLWGGSYGGYLTAMGLSRNPEIFKAGVDLHGVHDWSFDAQDATNSWGIRKEESELAFKSSPNSDLSKWKAPVLFVHGDDDRNVVFQQTTDLVEKLREKKVDVELLVLPDEVHGFLRYDSWHKVFVAAKDFFDRKLKTAP